MNKSTYLLKNEEATVETGRRLVRELNLSNELVFLNGDLGSGKTTLVRGILRSWGYDGPVKSPTYTLLEPYELADCRVLHFDFYRINDPEELLYIGIDDLLGEEEIKLVEWPSNGSSILPKPDIEIFLEAGDSSKPNYRSLEVIDHRRT